MAISNYGELKAKLSAYLFHQRLANHYDDCINLFETAANTRLRVRQMETSRPLVMTGGQADLPTDYLVWRTVLFTGTTPFVVLDYVHPEFFRSTWIERYSGNPKIFRILGNVINVKPADAANGTDYIQFQYYQKIPSLVGNDTNSNWLLTEYPNVYLYGVLTELAALQRNAEMAQLYKARRDETFAEIIQLSALSTGATSPQARTAEYF
jgi:hypothetical protein